MRYSSDDLSSRSDTFCNLRDTMGKETVASRTGQLLIDAIVSLIFNVTHSRVYPRLHARVSILFIYIHTYIYIYIYIYIYKIFKTDTANALRKYHRSNIERRETHRLSRLQNKLAYLSLYRKHERYDVRTIRRAIMLASASDVFHRSLTIIRTVTKGCNRRRREKGGRVDSRGTRVKPRWHIGTEILLENGNPFLRGCPVAEDSNKLRVLRAPRSRSDERPIERIFHKASSLVGSCNKCDASGHPCRARQRAR